MPYSGAAQSFPGMINQSFQRVRTLPTPCCQPAQQQPHCCTGVTSSSLRQNSHQPCLGANGTPSAPTPADQGELCPSLGFPSGSQQRPTRSTTCFPQAPPPGVCPLPRSTISLLLVPHPPSAPLLAPRPHALPLGSSRCFCSTNNRFLPPCRTDTQTHHPDSCRGRFCLSCWEGCQQTTLSCLSVPSGTVLAAEVSMSKAMPFQGCAPSDD